MWNHQNAALLRDLTSKFNVMGRIEERLNYFSYERMSALKNVLDPHNKDNVHTTLAMPSNAVRHVMNVDVADNLQSEFFKQVCAEECPDFLLKYAPLSAAMLLTTAVKFLAQQNPTAPVSYKSIADRLTNVQWTATKMHDNLKTAKSKLSHDFRNASKHVDYENYLRDLLLDCEIEIEKFIAYCETLSDMDKNQTWNSCELALKFARRRMVGRTSS
jgi:hypothetical protein